MASRDEIQNFTERMLREYETGFREWQAERGKVSPVLAVRLRDTLTVMSFYFTNRVPEKLPTKRDLEDVPVVLWQKDIWDAAARGAGDLEGSICPPMPENLCDWWIPNELTEWDGKKGDSPEPVYVMAQFLLRSERRESLTSRLWATPLGVGPMDDGMTNYPTKIQARPGELLIREDCETVARILFLQQEFIQLEETTLPRSFRRKYEREGLRVPEVRTVALRRRAREEAEPDREAGREFSRSWWVRGHWRKHWYPKDEVHKPLYISPYHKGDPGKPLKTERPTVYVAKR